MRRQAKKRYGMLTVLMLCAGLVLCEGAPLRAGGRPVSAEEHRIFSNARQAFDSRDLDGAATVLDRYFNSHSHRHPYAYELYGHLLLQTRQAEKALTILKKGTEEYPDNRNLTQNLAVAYARTGDAGHAGEAFLKAYALGEFKTPRLAFSAAVFFVRDQQHPKAANVVRELIAKEGLRPAWGLFLAQCYLRQQQPKQAVRLLERAVGRFPDHEKLWRMLAVAYYRADTLKKAVAACEIAHTMKPDTADAGESSRLATLYMNLGAAHMAAAAAKDASPVMLDNMAWCLAKTGDLEQARQKALEAMRKAPTGERRFRLAQILFRMNRRQQAKKHYAILSEADGDYQAKAQWALAVLSWQEGNWEQTHARIQTIKTTNPQKKQQLARLLQILETIMPAE